MPRDHRHRDRQLQRLVVMHCNIAEPHHPLGSRWYSSCARATQRSIVAALLTHFDHLSGYVAKPEAQNAFTP
jgi:hypothetical protein